MAGSEGGSRYETILKLASGGMATVFVGTVRGALGFRQLVAIKKPHQHLLEDPAFRSELVAEARLASMIHHANVVDVRDVEIDGSSISLIMDYIEGASLGDLLVAANRRGIRMSPRVCIRIVLDALAGLNAAHELVDERGRPIGLVHRDISPQNVLVGTDGTSRVADFGVAKFARKNMQSTNEGSLKGKLAYMPPEYLRGETIDRRFDIFAMGVVLWEALCGKRLFRGDNEAETLNRVLFFAPELASQHVPEVKAIDAVLECALAKSADDRFQNAAAMAAALEASAISAGLLAGHTEVAATLKDLVGPGIEERRTLVRSKLANEPSVASLMGVPPIVELARSDEIPATMVTETPKMEGAPPPTATAAAATPKMANAPSMAAPTVTSPNAGAATVMAASAVPSTLPMNGGVDVAPPQVRITTLESPAREATPAMTELNPNAATLPVAPSAPLVIEKGAGSTLRSDDGISPAPAMQTMASAPIAELAFHDASGRSFSGSITPAGLAPARSGSGTAIAIGIVAFVVLAGGTGAYLYARTGRGAAATPPSDPIASASAPAAAASSTPPIVEPPPATASATASAHPTAKGLPIKRLATPPPPTPPTVPTPSSTHKPPPPNPYATDAH